jgi:hypothetical protein
MPGVKPFVFRDLQAVGLEVPGGRPRRPRDLLGSMLILVGLIYTGQLISLFQLPVLVEYLFAGIILGTTAGKVVVVRREHRRVGELPPEEVRDTEIAWLVGGVALMACAALVQIAFNVFKTL